MQAPSATTRRLRFPAWLDAGAAALGLQMAIAGTAAFYFSQFLRLEFPSWSVFTVIMLLSAQYVGAIQEKAVLRMIGTVLGGLLGYLATGAWQQTPVLYLGMTFAITAFSVAMFSQSRAPYAFLLTGLTFVIIAINGQSDPQMAWQYSLARVEEVLVGVVASLVVQSTIWPRYANEDFLKQLRDTLEELAEATPRGMAMFRDHDAELDASLRDFPRRSTALRQLLYFGARESRHFRRNLAMHGSAVTSIARAANLLRSLDQIAPAPEPYLSALSGEFDEAGRTLRDGWLQLRDNGRIDDDWRSGMAGLLARIEEKLLVLRTDPRSMQLDAAQVGPVSAHVLTLFDLHTSILELDELWRNPPAIQRTDSLVLAPEWPDAAAVKRGLRAALATTVALVLDNWLSPPGGTLMVLCAFNFTALNYLSPTGIGDHRTFHFVVSAALVGLGAFLALLVLTPMMASYAVLNIVLASWLFLQGYRTYNRGGITKALTVSFLLLVSVLSLNAQEPVPFENITGIFFGLVTGALIAALHERLLWPILPQGRLRAGMVSYLRTIAGGIDRGVTNLPLWQRTKLALFPSEARKFITMMEGPAMPPGESRRLEEYILSLQKLAGEIILCAGRLSPSLPPDAAPETRNTLDEVKAALASGLNSLADSFGRAEQPPAADHLDDLIRRWDESVARLRRTFFADNVPPRTAIVPMGLSYRYRVSLGLLKRANAEARSLRPGEYLGDVSL
ncbi:MAG: FUSC family protein [Chthoniobacterales bacterium]|nr:FUSC family protein [Chthoniobacterales bacterium]